MFEHQGHSPVQIARARRLRRTMGFAEQKLWTELRKLKLPIRRQAPIGRYVADFAHHGAKLVIELDGEVHERLADVALRDIERTAWLKSEGYRVIRFPNRRVVEDLQGVVEEIKKALPLDGGGLGGGEIAGPGEGLGVARAPTGTARANALRSPPSPTLPPSRGKGDAPANASSGARE